MHDAVVELANRAHAGQVRKYNGNPYITHPIRVANAARQHGMSDQAVQAAILHDVLEDTNVGEDEIRALCGEQVLRLVKELTNPSHRPENKGKSRAARKAMDREHLRAASREAKQLKLLDRIDNLLEMAGAPSGFRRLYIEESNQLLAVIRDADEVLATRLEETIDKARLQA
jgi:guanosine-3',5'-bis(diphosphate) 3'-pyrophosphohydrolase